MIMNEYGQPYTRYIPGVERYLDGVPYSSNKEYLAAINSRIKELEYLAAKVSNSSKTLNWTALFTLGGNKND